MMSPDTDEPDRSLAGTGATERGDDGSGPVVADMPAGEMTGRPIVLTPVPPGVWLVIGGGVVAALGPLFGFLVGSMIGTSDDDRSFSPLYLCLFVGILVGALGVGAVMMGVRRMVVASRHHAATA